MKFAFWGLNHQNAPVELRERLAFDRAGVERFLDGWTAHFPDTEAVLVSTCNRTELYIGSPSETLPEESKVFDYIASEKGDAALADDLGQQLVRAADAEAAEHLFAVASSLESMVLGEPQILSQIKDAYLKASESETTGVVTHSAFQRCLAVAKRVAAQTALFRHHVSIPSVAVSDFALELFETLADKITLVLGAGEMAAETLRYLVDGGGKKIVVANRTRSRAEELAEQFGAEVIDWEDRLSALDRADLVIAACSTTEPILYRADLQRCLALRRGRPLFLLDLALPRNFDPDITQLENVYLYCLDDLNAACERNRKSRSAELPKAKKIVRAEAVDFWRDLRLRESSELICQLRTQWHAIKDSEVTRLFNKCQDLSPRQRQEIQTALDRFVNKALHAPIASLRDEIDTRPTNLLEAFVRLFHLKSGKK